ncbi:Stk1 family PASTA domain-containing Ser/Thr kinase [Cellulomonas hominis]
MGTTVTDPLVGRLVDGRYEVVSRIARGGMATVYLAIDRRLDREVALKVMHAHLAEGTAGADFVARFRREARSAARLTHPGLVGVYDQGVDGDTSYLTMEYVDGSNLRRYLGEQGALTVGDTLRIGEQILDALAAAHRVGLVHRDIKPENVLMSVDDRVKLADFGLARAVTEVTSTTTGTVLGTVAYLAPELVARGLSDARTDVYAAGILLYEMLTGSQPFTGETAIQVAFQHVNTDIPAPSDAVDWLPAEVDELVGALAARDPDDRPADAGAALTLLRRTRDTLDEATLARHADVAPTIVLPSATDPGADDEDTGTLDDTDPDTDAPDGTDDDDPDATSRLDVNPHGRTVALPIGLGAAEVVAAPPAELEQRRRRRRWVWLAAALVLVLALVGGGWWYQTEGPGAYTTVPPLANLTQEQAVDALTGLGLRANPTETFHDTVPQGSVVSSDPAEGGRIRNDGTVDLAISAGPDLVTVPAGLVGKMQAEAEAMLKAADLVPDYAEPVYRDDAGLGVVVASSAADNAQVHRGGTVTLTLSKGPAPATVTQVVGASQDAATRQLKADGFKVAAEPAFSDSVPAGDVISQSPEASTQGHRGDTVTLTVSQGPELFEIPDLTGMQFRAAEAKLAELGMTARRENVLGGLFGTVRDQDVKAGEKVPKGTVVTLTVV